MQVSKNENTFLFAINQICTFIIIVIHLLITFLKYRHLANLPMSFYETFPIPHIPEFEPISYKVDELLKPEDFQHVNIRDSESSSKYLYKCKSLAQSSRDCFTKPSEYDKYFIHLFYKREILRIILFVG